MQFLHWRMKIKPPSFPDMINEIQYCHQHLSFLQNIIAIGLLARLYTFGRKMVSRTFSNIHIIFLSMLWLLILFKSHPHFYIQCNKSHGMYFTVVIICPYCSHYCPTDNCLFQLNGWRLNEDNHWMRHYHIISINHSTRSSSITGILVL